MIQVKNYLKMVLTVFVIILFANNLFAQGAYININAGYGLKMSSQNLYYFNFYNYRSQGDLYTVEQVNVSFGKGLNFGGAFGYMINKNIGVEVGISYLIGGKSTAKDVYLSGTTDYTFSAKMLRINPSFVITSGFEKVNPYAKFGLIIGSGSVMYELNDDDNGKILVMNRKFNGGTALGLSSGIGAMLNINDKISFFGELNMVNLSYAPTRGEITEVTYIDYDILEMPYLTTYDREIEFVDRYTYDTSNLSLSQPRKELKQKLPFGSFGVNIGLKINF